MLRRRTSTVAVDQQKSLTSLNLSLIRSTRLDAQSLNTQALVERKLTSLVTTRTPLSTISMFIEAVRQPRTAKRERTRNIHPCAVQKSASMSTIQRHKSAQPISEKRISIKSHDDDDADIT